MRLAAASYLAVEDDDAGVVVFEVFDVEFDEVLAGTEEGGEAGATGAVVVVWSDVLGDASFFSPVVGTGASLPGEGFIFSE